MQDGSGKVNGTRASLRRRWSVFADAWSTQLWPMPSLGIAVAVALGVGLPRLDAGIDGRLPGSVTAYLFSGGPDAARTVLSVVASSLITVTSLTFSLTVVTLQLASSQFSPRLLRTFTRDRLVHLSLALLLATFVYAVTVLRTVRAERSDQPAFVPQVAVTVAYVLALVSVLTLVVFLAHLARQIRVEWMLREVHGDSSAAIAELLIDVDPVPESRPVPQVPADAHPLCATSSGFFTSVDGEALLEAAVGVSAVIRVDRLPGDSLIAGTPVASAWPLNSDQELNGDDLRVLQDCVGRAVDTGFERTPAQDVAFGLRQIVDVTVKALSPGVNDPTTAVHALGHVSALLCEMAGKDVGPRLLEDDDGRIRVLLRRPDFAELLELAVGQPRRYGAADPDVLSRVTMLLREVAWAAKRPEQHHAITGQLDRLSATVEKQDYDGVERARLQDQIRDVRQAPIGCWPGR